MSVIVTGARPSSHPRLPHPPGSNQSPQCWMLLRQAALAGRAAEQRRAQGPGQGQGQGEQGMSGQRQGQGQEEEAASMPSAEGPQAACTPGQWQGQGQEGQGQQEQGQEQGPGSTLCSQLLAGNCQTRSHAHCQGTSQ